MAELPGGIGESFHWLINTQSGWLEKYVNTFGLIGNDQALITKDRWYSIVILKHGLKNKDGLMGKNKIKYPCDRECLK